MFFCEFCENFKNIFFTEHLRTTASVKINFITFAPQTRVFSKDSGTATP